MSVVVLGLIPEEFLFGPHRVNRFNQASREEVGKGPDHFVHFGIEQGEIIIIILQLVINPFPGLLKCVTCLKLPINDLTVINILIRDDLGIADPISLLIFEHRGTFGDEGLHLHLVSTPHLAADAIPHGIFHT